MWNAFLDHGAKLRCVDTDMHDVEEIYADSENDAEQMDCELTAWAVSDEVGKLFIVIYIMLIVYFGGRGHHASTD